MSPWAGRPSRRDVAGLLRRAASPPVREGRFWIVQAMVLVVAGAHLAVDLVAPAGHNAFPDGLPVALLIVPVGYAALHYGLSGSAATGLWAGLLWLPDLLLPHDRGHAGSDVVNLALVEAVAFFVGQHIESERLARGEADRANAAAFAVEARYHQLFETNRSPILVLDRAGQISDANPAAAALLGGDLVGRTGASVLGDGPIAEEARGQVCILADGHDYRVEVVALPAGSPAAAAQVIFEDVTEERSDSRRATRYAELLVKAEEEQRQRLARELHDEPLQLFLHLARSLERLGGIEGIPPSLAGSLEKARQQALDAAGRLRSLARDLRPPALDQLGFVPALSSHLADVEEESGVPVDFAVEGPTQRLPGEVELGAFRIAEEAVRNALRHGTPAHLAVRVVLAEDHLVVRVADDGQGFAPESAEGLSSGHLGLAGMHERARLLGGDLACTSSPGAGTVIEATLPLEAPRPERAPARRAPSR